MSTTVALLDDRSRLIGLKTYDGKGRRGKVPEGAIIVSDAIDLPMDGSYKWMPDDECFMPVGHGNGKPTSPPMSTHALLHYLAQQVDNPSQQVLDWMAWYRRTAQ